MHTGFDFADDFLCEQLLDNILRRVLILTGQSSDRPYAGEESLVQGIVDLRIGAFDAELAEDFTHRDKVDEGYSALICDIRALGSHVQ